MATQRPSSSLPGRPKAMARPTVASRYREHRLHVAHAVEHAQPSAPTRRARSRRPKHSLAARAGGGRTRRGVARDGVPDPDRHDGVVADRRGRGLGPVPGLASKADDVQLARRGSGDEVRRRRRTTRRAAAERVRRRRADRLPRRGAGQVAAVVARRPRAPLPSSRFVAQGGVDALSPRSAPSTSLRNSLTSWTR